MKSFNDYLAQRSDLSSDIERFSKMLEELGHSAHSKHLLTIRKRLLKDDFRILICGEFKRGKSCLINAMLGEKILPMKVAPCTAVVTEVTYAEHPSLTIFPIDGQPFQSPTENISTHIAISQTGKNSNAKVQVNYPLDLCQNAVTIIDSPGLNEHFERTDISLQQIAQADAVIMVLSCEMALSRSEMNFIETHLSDRHFGLFFVWNRFDAIRDVPEECVVLQARSDSKLGHYNAEVCNLSARDALLAQINKDVILLDRSGLLPFMNALESYLTTQRGQTKLLQPIASMRSIAKLATETLYPQNVELLSTSLEQLKSRQTNARQKFDTLDQQRKATSLAIQLTVKQIITELTDALNAFLKSAPDKAYLDSQNLSFPEDAGRQERQDLLRDWYQVWLQKSLNSLAQETLTPMCKTAIHALESTLRNALSDFENELDSVIKLGETGIDIDGLLKDDWMKEIPDFASTAAALLLLGVSSGAIATSLLGLGALRAWLSGAILGSDDRRRIANAFGDALKQNEPEMTQILQQNIEELGAQLAKRIDDHLQPLILDADALYVHATNASEAGETQIAEYQSKLSQFIDETNALVEKYGEMTDASSHSG
ncbi:MAG: dynamin family protein [Myxococcota bacterium]